MLHPRFNPPRWTEEKLASDGLAAPATGRRPKIRYEYWVTGKGSFPLDMLRYDCAWPASGDDAPKINGNLWPSTRSIRMRSYQEPTVERWSSFGWTCGTEKLDG
jgi:hypothetical protein